MISLNGNMVLSSRIFARPSVFGERSLRKREKKDFVLDSKAKSVQIFEASSTRGVKWLDSWLMSPVCRSR